MKRQDDSNAGLGTTFSQTDNTPFLEENEVVKSPVVAALREYFKSLEEIRRVWKETTDAILEGE